MRQLFIVGVILIVSIAIDYARLGSKQEFARARRDHRSAAQRYYRLNGSVRPWDWLRRVGNDPPEPETWSNSVI